MIRPEIPTIDREQLLELIDRAVAERGEDYKYPAPGFCMFIWENGDRGFGEGSGLVEGEPACLLGLALSYLEPEIPGVLDFLQTFSNTDLRTLMDSPGLPFVLAPDALEAGQAAQDVQDDNKTWGAALRMARDWEPSWNGDDDE